MTAKTSTIKEYLPAIGGKVVKLEVTGTTGDSTDITLANYGIESVEAVKGFVHATTDNVIYPQDPSTAVSSGVLTLTFSSTLSTLTGTSADHGSAGYPWISKKFVFVVYGD